MADTPELLEPSGPEKALEIWRAGRHRAHARRASSAPWAVRRRLRRLVLRAGGCTRRASWTWLSRSCGARGYVYEADGAVWLRTTDVGDYRDRVLVLARTAGLPTRLADCAYYLDKRERGFDRCI